MDWLWTFLIYTIDWKIQVAILAVVIGGPVLLIAAAFLGWPATIRYVTIPLVGIIAVLGAASKLRQSGYKDRVVEEEKALDKAEEIVDEKRDEIETLPDDKLDERLDKWTRP